MSYEKLGSEDKFELALLHHDKKHVLIPGKKLKALENVLEHYSEKAPNLYRGIYKEEVASIGDLRVGKTFSLNRYTSFSENLRTGLKFGYGTRFVLFLKEGFGFNYSKYSITILEDLKKEDPREYQAVDGDRIISGLKTEKEWIMPMEAEYKILGFKTAHGYTVISCSMI